MTRIRLSRADRRAAILDGAAHAFAAGGFAGTSMADIALATGVSHLIVYRHFPSKEALYEQILTAALDRLTAALATDGAIGPHGPTPAAMLALARADPAGFEVLWRHAAREPRFGGWADRARAQLVEATAAALRPEVSRATVRWAARATAAYLVESVLVWIEDGDAAMDARFTAATAAALRAGVRTWSRSP